MTVSKEPLMQHCGICRQTYKSELEQEQTARRTQPLTQVIHRNMPLAQFREQHTADSALPMGSEPTKKARIESPAMPLVHVDIKVCLRFKVRTKNRSTTRAGLDPEIVHMASTQTFWELKSMIVEEVNMAWRGPVCNEQYDVLG